MSAYVSSFGLFSRCAMFTRFQLNKCSFKSHSYALFLWRRQVSILEKNIFIKCAYSPYLSIKCNICVCPNNKHRIRWCHCKRMTRRTRGRNKVHPKYTDQEHRDRCVCLCVCAYKHFSVAATPTFRSAPSHSPFHHAVPPKFPRHCGRLMFCLNAYGTYEVVATGTSDAPVCVCVCVFLGRGVCACVKETHIIRQHNLQNCIQFAPPVPAERPECVPQM